MVQSDSPQALPAEIRVKSVSTDATRYILPRRPLGHYRWFAIVPLAFGVFALVFFWQLFGVFAVVRFNPIMLPFMACGAFLLVSAGLAPIVVAAAMVFGHSSIVVDRGKLRTIEHVGPLRWRRTFRSAQIKRLLVAASNSRSEAPPRGPTRIARLALIRIEVSRGKPGRAAPGYPREWLEPLARELARQLSTPPQNSFGDAIEQPIAVVPVEVADDARPVERLDRPAGSQIVMQQTADSLTFEIPPLGFRGLVKGILIFACIWLAFPALFTIMVFIAKQPPGQPGGRLGALAFIGVFWLIGAGILLLAICAARRRAAIAVAHGECLVIQKGVFSEKRNVWQAGELSTVRVERSEANEQQMLELQFISRAGKKFGMLGERKRDELEWLATHLRKALDLAAAPAIDAALADVEVQPAESRVALRQLDEGLTISIPRPAIRQGPSFWWMFAIVWNLFDGGMFALFWHTTRGGGLDRVMMLLFFVPFTLVGVGMLVAAIHMSIQRAEIAVAGGRLLVLRMGLFGTRRNEWSAGELAAIRASPSGVVMGSRQQMQLQIVPSHGKTIKLLSGRDPQELAWIATMLRRSLNIAATAESPSRSAFPG